eukprot:356082-Chlamydomonas_euryale.AAC.4
MARPRALGIDDADADDADAAAGGCAAAGVAVSASMAALDASNGNDGAHTVGECNAATACAGGQRCLDVWSSNKCLGSRGGWVV